MDCMHLSQDGDITLTCKHSNKTSRSLTEGKKHLLPKKSCDPWSWLFNDNDLVINYSAQIHWKVTKDVLKGIIPKIIRKE